MKAFWDERYSGKEHAYGTTPNAFFKEKLDRLKPGKLLLPAEGEGRNAVYAASQGWEVIAFDQSSVAKQKALAFASKHNVNITYEICEIGDFESPENYFNCIALTFVHIPPQLRTGFHKGLIKYLKPGGILLLEGFEKSQISRETCGPKNVEMLFSKEELYNDFKALQSITISECESTLDEGIFHNGVANLIRLKGTK